ncbi:hypothetical protein MRX96_028435 [Rhipicephalus microplus]
MARSRASYTNSLGLLRFIEGHDDRRIQRGNRNPFLNISACGRHSSSRHRDHHQLSESPPGCPTTAGDLQTAADFNSKHKRSTRLLPTTSRLPLPRRPASRDTSDMLALETTGDMDTSAVS